MRGYAWLTEIVQVLSMFRVRAGWGRLGSHIWWSLQGPGAPIFVFSLRHIAVAAVAGVAGFARLEVPVQSAKLVALATVNVIVQGTGYS
jgi:hypothetical protein